MEVADQTCCLTQSQQHTDSRPASPGADPMTPGAWQGSQPSTDFHVCLDQEQWCLILISLPWRQTPYRQATRALSLCRLHLFLWPIHLSFPETLFVPVCEITGMMNQDSSMYPSLHKIGQQALCSRLCFLNLAWQVLKPHTPTSAARLVVDDECHIIQSVYAA